MCAADINDCKVRFVPESQPDTSFIRLFIGGSGPALLFLGIFYVMFLGSDLKNGFIKNTAGAVHNRASYILSKELTLAVYSLVGIAVLSLGSFLCAVVLFDGTKSAFILKTRDINTSSAPAQ